MSKKEIKCCECNSDFEENYYKYENKLYCFDCLIEELEKDERLHIVRETRYYNEDWGNLGTDDEISEVIQNVCEKYEIKEIENDFE